MDVFSKGLRIDKHGHVQPDRRFKVHYYEIKYGKIKEPNLKDLKNHPWEAFLEARVKAMLWMRDDLNCSNIEIAKRLSMDENQVELIFKPINNSTKTTIKRI